MKGTAKNYLHKKSGLLILLFRRITIFFYLITSILIEKYELGKRILKLLNIIKGGCYSRSERKRSEIASRHLSSGYSFFQVAFFFRVNIIV